MFKKNFPVLILLFTIMAVILIGFHSRWYDQLVGDAKYYYTLADYFFNNLKLIGYKDPIAYPPGANTFFLLMGAVFFISHSFAAYQIILISMNILFLVLLARLYKNYLALALIIICAGPLILFRFDLLVVLFTALAIKSFKDSKTELSMFYLGLAAMTKIFPVVLLPYFLLLTLKKTNNLIPPIKLAAIFGLTVVISLFLYMVIFKDPPSSILAMLNYNFTKSVHIESPLGSFLTVATMFKYPGPHPIGFINGLFILTPIYLLGHARIFRFTNSLGLISIYLLIIFSWKKIKKLNIQLCLTIILTLLATSQVVSPQYLIWPFFLIPLLSAKTLQTTFWKINLILIAFIFLLTQWVYPLNYYDLIFNFYGAGKTSEIFWINTTRNILLIILVIRLLISFFFKSSEEAGDQ